jgi:hypothetical protein
MPTATETELLDKTEFTPKGKDRQKVLESIARAVDNWCVDDEKKPKSKQNWEKLSEAAQAWYNAAIDAIEARNDIPDFEAVVEDAEPEDDEEPDEEPDEPEEEPEDEPEDEESEENDEDEAEDEESEDEAEETAVVSTATSETGRRAKAPPPPVKKAKAKVEAPTRKIVGKAKEVVKEAKANGKAKVKAKVAKVREREESGISGSEYIRILTIKHPDWTSAEIHAQCKKDGYDVSGLLVSSIRSAAINVCKHLKAEGFRVPKFRQRASED